MELVWKIILRFSDHLTINTKLAIITCFQQWRSYLIHSPHVINVYSDHKNLTFFKTLHLLKPRHARWHEFLSQFNFTLTHISGTSNVVADALSRTSSFDSHVPKKQEMTLLPAKNWSLNVISTSDWPETIASFLENNSWPVGTTNLPFLIKQVQDFRIKDDKLYYVKDKMELLYLPITQRRDKIKRFHEGLAHLATNSIIDLIQRRFWWPRLRFDVDTYIAQCPQCQLNRPESGASKAAKIAQLRPVPPVALPFERIGIDFIQNLPCTKSGNRHIITCIDYATRWIIAKAVPSMDSATVVQFLYSDILLKLRLQMLHTL
jgi:hypothetical protein